MNAEPNIAEVAALIGDPARANILTALMDGRALTASELAYRAHVTPQTTSHHLARLKLAALIAEERQGRHRYYRLTGPEIGEILEKMIVVAVKSRPKPPRPDKAVDAIRRARVCYDHLAGQLGVELTQAMIARRHLQRRDRDFHLTGAGERFVAGLGIELAAVRKQRRAFARACLDWSERRPHLAGALGAALAARLFELGWLRRTRDDRSVSLTEAGRSALAERFAVTLAR
ncbi:MAG TPA: metalloregulator ArsR/SmtB family transcription factor [Candidatus Sulfotelmatobacter sp.]|nr:metalloregulator ArsR/SmtB family transcription factor [Candidatus Sulfotelmatobacter sp.]